MNFVEGEVLLFNKPYAWTSFDLVNKIRKGIANKLKIKKIKVGHTGTLDPLATGLMIICTGMATKKIDNFINLNKEYLAKIEFGATTPSFDLETEIDKKYEYKHITKELIDKALHEFKGESFQKPPAFSAKYVNGKRAYKYAREGKEIKLESHKITIEELELLSYNAPIAEIRILCSKGTYIRTFAKDLGEKLESGAFLTGLIRTAIGDYSLKNALTIKDFDIMLL